MKKKRKKISFPKKACQKSLKKKKIKPFIVKHWSASQNVRKKNFSKFLVEIFFSRKKNFFLTCVD
jgi:hypothetical protein